MNTRILIATVVVSMFVCQQVRAQDDPVMPEATELEGTWRMVSKEINGERREADGYLWRFEGNRRYWGKVDDDGNWMTGDTFSVDPSATPAEIDFEANLALRSVVIWEARTGIYKIEDDSLTICIGIPRPDEFDSSKALYVFRRVTEEDDE